MTNRRAFLGLLLVPVLPTASAAAGPAQQRAQSPIDFRPGELEPADLPDPQFRYSSSTTLTMTYASAEDSPCGDPGEEETVRAVVPPGAGLLRVGRREYQLEQVHWHTRAEHLLNGYRFPLEQHLVHRDADGNLLVIGVWIRHGRPHRTLGRLFGRLPQECTPDLSVDGVDLNAVLPRSHRSMRYPGSLTTKPYSEGVSWLMLTRPIPASVAQVEAFAGRFPHGNSRDVQPLSGRTVQLDVGPR